ncbi:hypothetical protein QTI17_30775 [Variovorax sp. J31P179]|jgi:hypothetical protein|uniref:hypothetical protein n=1 Tax=Variovorax sp. J31P179 TaxID=3053508 RepID=UPI002577149F|nr:hypothetical protein [Variovorax sp. J31P179]MDM0084984.1 hypothetical protein [Variovorax sp. J31P179]
MTAELVGNESVCRSAVLAGVLALSGGSIAFGQGTLNTCLSGFEVSRGTDVAGGLLTKGVTFAGVDDLAKDGGVPNPATCPWTTNGNGGSWTAKIDRIGVAGIGGSGVTVVGGRWYWLDRDNNVQFGRVEGGFVRWPGTVDQDIGCGAGVAQFALSVRNQFSPGTIAGCLDDTHLDPARQPFVFPPHISGALRLN